MQKQQINNKSILIVVGFIPFSAIFGGAIDVWERIKGLHHLGYNIDLIVTDKVEPTKQQLDEIGNYVNQFYFVKRQNKIWQLAGNLPLQYLSRLGLQNIIIDNSYDLLILESEFCWAITKNKTVKYNKLVVRVHNIESYYFKMLGKSSKSIKEKVYYKIESVKIKNLSKMVFNQADRLWFISKDDILVVNQPNKSVFMPLPINDDFVQPKSKSTNNVVFMGSLFMQNNTFGLDWYLQKVHPFLIDKIPNYHFYIIGSLKEENQYIKQKYSHLKNVTLVINAKCLKQYYENSVLFVNPMFHGSGVKVKSVNALANGLPLVSTSVGVEGIGLSNDMYYHAETENDFLNQIISILENQEIALQKTTRAQLYLQENNYLNVLKKELDVLI